MKLITLMGGKVLKINGFKVDGFPFTIVYKRPPLFKREHIKREVRCGKYYADFANDVGWAIEVDGQDYHMDVLADLEREGYFIERGWRQPLRIQAFRLYNDKQNVQKEVLSYLIK